MISSTPRPTISTFDSFTVNTVEPIYDTFKGQPIYIPQGYTVKVTGESSGFYHITTILPAFGLKPIRTTATAQQLGIQPAPTTPLNDESDVEADEPAVGPPQALVPRIYQEYGITFLLYKTKAFLADAPGVGKTLQALEASWRAMNAAKLGIDPLSLCYLTDYRNSHDEKNTHPTERPEWATPHQQWVTSNISTSNTSSINVSVRQRDYYWASNYRDNPCTVIVAPNHLCSMWYKAIRAQYPDAYVALATGGGSNKAERLSVITPGHQFVIVNYEMMRAAPEPKDKDYVTKTIPTGYGYDIETKVLRDDYVVPRTFVDALNDLNPMCVIFDESHNLKSVKSKQAKECAAFAHRIPYRFLLTATPIKREADDLYMQFHVIDPERFDGRHLNGFTYQYCFYNQTEYGKTNIQLRDYAKREFWFNRIGTQSDQSYDASDIFTKKSNKRYDVDFNNPNLAGYILGRSYKDVGLYLPPVLPATIPVEMDAQIRKIYEKMKKSYVADFEEYGTIEINSMIAMLHNLRILTACPNKYKAVQELIEDNEGPFAIFCEYRPSGQFLADILGTTFISGDVPVEERENLVASLLAEGKPIVGMGRVIGTGINAMADCNVVVNFEADWTPGERTQRIGRVQRFSPNRPEGQPVLLFDVMVTDSIDQHVYEVQRNRGISIRDIITVELGLK